MVAPGIDVAGRGGGTRGSALRGSVVPSTGGEQAGDDDKGQSGPPPQAAQALTGLSLAVMCSADAPRLPPSTHCKPVATHRIRSKPRQPMSARRRRQTIEILDVPLLSFDNGWVLSIGIDPTVDGPALSAG